MQLRISEIKWGLLWGPLLCLFSVVIVVPADATQQSVEGPAEESSALSEYEQLEKEAIAELAKIAGSERVAAARYKSWDKSFERIIGEILTLKNESIEDSLSRLSEIELFFTFGHIPSADPLGVEIPLDGIVGSGDVQQVFSNRRVLKLLHELTEEPPARAAALLSGQIKLNLAVYKEMFRNEIMDEPRLRIKDLFKDSKFAAGLGYRMSSYEDGSPVIQGVRHSLFALVMIAGILELDEAEDAIGEIIQVAIEQRAYFYAHEANGLNSILSHQALRGGSLYNRQVLSIGILGLSGEREVIAPRLQKSLADELEAQDAELTEVNPWQEGWLPDYDVFITPYGYLWAHIYRSGTVPPDFKEDGIPYAYAPFVTDSDFDAIHELFTTTNVPN